MDAPEVYNLLIENAAPAGSDDFDMHVLASILSLAYVEADKGSICHRIGLDGVALQELVAAHFPRCVAYFVDTSEPPIIDEEEQSVRDILWMYASKADRFQRYLVAMIARRCKSPHHLWQDLGLRNRGELSRLMRHHFGTLCEKNRGDMKWKKFLYRMVCRSAGFSLCAAPVCSDCDDFAACFGDEEGDSLLARIRNGQGSQLRFS